jgi:hypothetical protein
VQKVEKQPDYTDEGNGHERDAAEISVQTLHDLFDSNETFLLSNAAVATLLKALLTRYKLNTSPRDRMALILHWKKDQPRLREALEHAASEEKLAVDEGFDVPHLTQERVQTLMGRVCPADPYLPNPPAPKGRTRSVR